ncbi:hypothetical protein [Herpetosiphon geysericola]|uniref:Uncharacterized protein n=1 Tax=Herpetosiphon geysericola TaxID=70996 RepID=A0A0P6YDG0_9CHLR|nr:hypothetical protein [Herpetosiphon geysericola]KPL83046.1 hypothetical protein SE18_19590 [Herpetosiphon geysericola]
MTNDPAMIDIYQTIAALDDQIACLNAEREQARTTLSGLVEAAGGKVILDGVATMEITRPAIVMSYDRAGLEALVRKLVANGRGGIAEMIEKQRKQHHRAGSLRITKTRGIAPNEAA